MAKNFIRDAAPASPVAPVSMLTAPAARVARTARPTGTSSRTARSPFEKVFSAIDATKVDPKLASREFIDVSGRIQVKMFPTAQFLSYLSKLECVEMQRNDRYRLQAQMTKHLDKYELPQSNFTLVACKGKVRLVDGNTRKRLWLGAKGVQLPSHVVVTVMVAQTEEDVRVIYDCIDSKHSSKNHRDQITSFIREQGVNLDTLKSPLVAGGKLVSVVNYMTRAHFGGCATKERKRTIVANHIEAICALDEHNLNEKQVRGGAVWAALRLYQAVPAQFREQVGRYVEEVRRVSDERSNLPVLGVVQAAHFDALAACRAALVGTSGESAMPVMFPAYLTGFLNWAQTLTTSNSPAEFRRYAKKRLETEVIAPELERYVRFMALRSKKAVTSRAKAAVSA